MAQHCGLWAGEGVLLVVVLFLQVWEGGVPSAKVCAVGGTGVRLLASGCQLPAPH